MSGTPFVWSSSNPSIVTVTAGGYATAVAPGSTTIVATSNGVTGTAAVTVTSNPNTTPSSSSVSPPSASLVIGGTQQLSAVVSNLVGGLLGGLVTTWSSSNTSVASVTSSGVVTALTAGTATITASTLGFVATSLITVIGSGSPPPPVNGPEPMPNFGTTLVQDALAETSLLATLLNFAPMIGSLGDYMSPDPTAGPNGTTALRITWPKSTTCQDDWSGIEHAIPGAPTEIYMQYSVRYQAGFSFDWLYSGQTPCTGTAKKLVLIWSGDNASRFLYITENHELHAGSDYDEVNKTPMGQNTGSTMALSQLGDGNWHRITFHIKQSSTRTSTDGFVYGWIDGVLRWSRPNWASGSIGGWVDLKMPSTFNQGSPANQSEWMSGLTIWKP